MKNLGKVFKELRESRKISLRKATGGGFSASLLSRFENGKSEISAQKLFVALENIHAKVFIRMLILNLETGSLRLSTLKI